MTYLADQFIDKNKDYVIAEHQDLLTASKCPFVAGLFPPLPEESSKSSKFSSIGSRFKVFTQINYGTTAEFLFLSILSPLLVLFLDINKYTFMEQRLSFFFLKMQLQLQSLMETLNSTEPHYIRCVKPNNVLKPAIFENFNIIQQLRCGVSMSCL